MYQRKIGRIGFKRSGWMFEHKIGMSQTAESLDGIPFGKFVCFQLVCLFVFFFFNLPTATK